MKNPLSYVRGKLARRLSAATMIALAVFLPVSASAAGAANIQGNLGVANVTAGDTQYKKSINASYDQVVKFQILYQGATSADVSKSLTNPRVKFNIPSGKGQTQTISASISATNSNTVTDQVTVNLGRSDAYLQYLAGSAVYKHAQTNGQIVENIVSDGVVTNSQGAVLTSQQPCAAASVTVLARVMVPGVKIVKQSRVLGSQTWSNNDVAKPGDTLEYLITYTNTGNTQEKSVVIRDNLPPKLQLVPGTTFLANATNPNGVKYNSDNIASGGIVIGNYGPGANAFVKFQVKVPAVDQLACGNTEFRNVGVVRPEGMDEFYNTAITTVARTCQNTPPPTTPTPPSTPVSPSSTALPNTGAGSTIAIFGGVSALAALGHYFVGRRARV